MKTAFELAMERLGGEAHTYSPAQKEQLAEVDRVHDAKAAQVKLDAEASLKEPSEDAEKTDQIQKQMVVDLAAIEEQREKAKSALREQFTETE